jgi:hypothetical protein
MEDQQTGFKAQFYLGYLRALEQGIFPQQQEDAEVLEKKRCGHCGQPTQSDGLCTFCRLVSISKKEKSHPSGRLSFDMVN